MAVGVGRGGGELEVLAGEDEVGVVGWAEAVAVEVDERRPVAGDLVWRHVSCPFGFEGVFGDAPEAVATLDGHLAARTAGRSDTSHLWVWWESVGGRRLGRGG